MKQFISPNFFILIFLFSITPIKADIKAIQRVEPPSWWTHFKERKLELLVYGEGIGKAKKIRVYNSAKKIEKKINVISLKKTDNKNYLFIELELKPSIKAGLYTFKLSGSKGKEFSYEIKEPTKGRDYANGFDATDVIYLLMPDRFANGDIKNDNIQGMLSGTDRSSPGDRHGGDLRGILDRLDYLQDLGITGIWMTPVFENDMPVSYGEYAGQSYGAYHGYAATDLYKVDRRFGSNDEYRNLIDKAHTMGIKVIMDFIHNRLKA